MSTQLFYGEVCGMSGILYVVATPIGNLEDVTRRASRILSEADAIVCEDTRVTSKLLASLAISKPLLSLHARSKDAAQEKVMDRLRSGLNIAFVSDAGTPNMNDPGGKLVEQAMAEGITVVPIPGSSALTTAISVCGFPLETFTYIGFIPHKKGRVTLFQEIASRGTPTIFLETTHRIMKTLEQLRAHLDPRRLIFIGRELTKLHESLYRGTIEEVTAALLATSVKGEFVVIVGKK